MVNNYECQCQICIIYEQIFATLDVARPISYSITVIWSAEKNGLKATNIYSYVLKRFNGWSYKRFCRISVQNIILF